VRSRFSKTVSRCVECQSDAASRPRSPPRASIRKPILHLECLARQRMLRANVRFRSSSRSRRFVRSVVKCGPSLSDVLSQSDTECMTAISAKPTSRQLSITFRRRRSACLKVYTRSRRGRQHPTSVTTA
jgi:hypothetical protein